MSDINVMLIYRTLKVGDYFKLKSSIPLPLVSDVVYRFTCPCDTDETYIGMSSRHLITREREYLNLNNNRKTAIKNHLQQCKSCSKTKIDFYSSFAVLKKCSFEYNAKIHEALLIIQNKPLLNKQLYMNVCCF